MLNYYSNKFLLLNFEFWPKKYFIISKNTLAVSDTSRILRGYLPDTSKNRIGYRIHFFIFFYFRILPGYFADTSRILPGYFQKTYRIPYPFFLFFFIFGYFKTVSGTYPPRILPVSVSGTSTILHRVIFRSIRAS